MFLERLFDAFDLDGNHRIDLDEFIMGLSVFFKGTEDEKMQLSFRLYDINRSGTIEPKELIKVLIAMVYGFLLYSSVKMTHTPMKSIRISIKQIKRSGLQQQFSRFTKTLILMAMGHYRLSNSVLWLLKNRSLWTLWKNF